MTRNDIKHRIITSKLSNEPVELMVVEKSEELYQEMILLASKGISPSALGSYLNNPIDFYYQKILKIREVDEVEETVAVNTMGTVIHETLEQLYLPYIGAQLNEEIVKKMKLQSNNIVELNFKKVYKNGDLTHGKNKLIFEVSKNYLKRFLNLELAEIRKGKRIEILSLEEKLSIEIQIEGLDFPIKLGGIVDRIDRVDGVLRILDYKTGMVKATDLKMPDFSVMKEGYKYSKSLQVMLYAYLYCSKYNIDESQNVEAGIISFKNLNSGFLKMNFGVGRTIDSSISKTRMEDFMEALKLILKEIFNRDIPFKENPDKLF